MDVEDKNKVITLLNQNCSQDLSERSLEEYLMQLLLNPMKLKRQRTSVVGEKEILGILNDIREGLILNENGMLEEIREEYRHVQVLRDGTPVNQNGFSKCQTCGSIVSIDSIRRCPCGQTCCISKNCGFYSKKKDEWYCSRKHASLSFFKINPRWF